MTRKRALIVDDSKSARVVLSRMLEKYGIEVDMAESAEQSIAYLEHNRPDAIFMDHLMPGMDGLQAVQAIKANPRTAMIPIMMYTSQEGELYVGQARALGAMGVLPKQLRPVDVSKVLYELHLLPERRDVEESALTPVELAPSAAAAPADYLGRRVEAAVRGQTTEMRRFILTSLEGFATRVVGELRDLPPRAPPEQPPARGSIAASIAAVLVATGFAVLWMGARDEIARLRAQLAARSATLTNIERSRDQLDAIIKRLTAAGASAASPTAALPGASALVRTATVPYGQEPLGRARLKLLRTLSSQLLAEGFHGVVKVTSYAGLFCLSGNASDGYVLAKADLAAAKCAAIGNPFEQSLSGQQRQSLAFGNFVAALRERSGGAISVTIEDGGSSPVAVPYPARTAALTAGEWNKAAAANNRVVFAAESTLPAMP